MSEILETVFKKLLGKGRAFSTPRGFTSEFFDLLVSPISDLKTKTLGLKLTHFPTKYTDEHNIINSEEMFGIENAESMTLNERAANIESQWGTFGGSQTFKQIELILQKKNLPVYVIENIPQSYNVYGARVIGNGYLHIENEITDPAVHKNGLHTFIIQASDFMTSNQFYSLVESVVKIKPAEKMAYVIPRYLRKKEIHNVMTKSKMQSIIKSYYCDVRVEGNF